MQVVRHSRAQSWLQGQQPCQRPSAFVPHHFLMPFLSCPETSPVFNLDEVFFWKECEVMSQRCSRRPFRDDPRSFPPTVGETQGFALVVHSVLPFCEGAQRCKLLQKEGGGVRDMEAATVPFQYALSTRSGCECIAHALQVVTELDPKATITTICGISACGSTSRRAMLLGLARWQGRGREGGDKHALARLFCSEPSACLW